MWRVRAGERANLAYLRGNSFQMSALGPLCDCNFNITAGEGMERHALRERWQRRSMLAVHGTGDLQNISKLFRDFKIILFDRMHGSSLDKAAAASRCRPIK
jgi:hypothetical protein